VNRAGALGEMQSNDSRDPDGNVLEIARYPEAASATARARAIMV
jgi:hypothetical protein